MLTLIYPYYDNPKMLMKQIEVWNSYDEYTKDKVEIILVDDCSQKFPALEIFKDCTLKKKLFRVTQNIPWNQHGARNLGAQNCETCWMYMSDIDIILDKAAARNLAEFRKQKHKFYMFDRTFEDGRWKIHPNTFLVTFKHYWKINGYDEDYCGTYGGDGAFIRQLKEIAEYEHLGNIVLRGVDRKEVSDANTTEWDRDGVHRQKYQEIFRQKRKVKDEKSYNPIRFPWEQQI